MLAGEVLGYLGGKERVLDCTLGGGGHALALLESGTRSVIGIDRDPDAIAAARARLDEFDAKAERTGVPSLLTAMRDAGIAFKDLDTKQSSLEDIFVGLIHEQRNEQRSAAE